MKYKSFVSVKEQQLGNILIPENTIIVVYENGDKILCKNFPRNYKGNDPVLTIWYWDEIHKTWECDVWKNHVTKLLWKIYVNGGCKKTPQLIAPQAKACFGKVPHGKKIGNVQQSYMGDPAKKRLSEQRTTDHPCFKGSTYNYHSNLGCYGKSGDSMDLL